MKKRCLIILCALLLIVQLAGCSTDGIVNADSAKPSECEHSYTSVITKEATYDAEGEMTYSCTKCDSTYTEAIAKLEKHVVPASVLDSTVSSAKYYVSAFSISVAELVNSAMTNYELKHYTAEEAIEKGLLKKSDIGSSVDINYVYYSIVSGDTLLNPEIPYWTEYEEEAIKVWMIFNEDDELVNCGVELCKNLETCAIILMT